MKSAVCFCVAALILVVSGALAPALPPEELYWPYWRGPAADGMASGDAPLHWSDTKNVLWTTDIPGRGHSSPVVWGDRIFLTTAIPTTPAASPEPAGGSNRDGFGGGNTGPQPEHRFVVMCLDRTTGKVLWERTANTASPHEGYHTTYGSYASNSPVADGNRVRLPKTYSFKSSPVGVNGKLYLASENEDVVVLGMGEKYEVLAVNTMSDEVFIATPAITGGEIFLRSQKRIYCIQ